MVDGGGSLAREDREALERDGVVRLRGALDRRWLGLLDGVFARAQAELEPIDAELANDPDDGRRLELSRERFAVVTHRWRRDPDLAAFIFESPVARIAREILGCNEVLGLFTDQLFIQEAGGVPSCWHHGRIAFPLSGEQYLNIWIPLDPIPRGTGGLVFAAGTHRDDAFYIEDGHPLLQRADRRVGEGGRYATEPLPELDDNPAYSIIGHDYQPGDIAAFGMQILHKADGDASTSIARRALTLRWYGDDIRYDHRPEIRATGVGPMSRLELVTGDRLDQCELFPVVWSRAAGSVRAPGPVS